MSTFVPTPAHQSVAESLSADQLRVAQVEASALLGVWGAAGVGKTSALVGRFAQLLLGGLAPEEILVLAATRESAGALRDRLALELQGATLGPLCRTATSVAHSLVRAQALTRRQPLPELISGGEQDVILSELIKTRESSGGFAGWPRHLDATTRSLAGFRDELRQLIATAQEFDLSPQQLRELDPNKQEWVLGAELYEEYLQVLAGPDYENRFDAPALLTYAVEMLGKLPEGERAPYRVVLIDDAQELTPSASRFVRALLGQDTGLTLFGDPDAAVLGFRGAMPELALDLLREAAEDSDRLVQQISLEDFPWAVKPELIDVLDSVSEKLRPAGAGGQRRALAKIKPESPEASVGGREVRVFASKLDETAWLARRLRELHLMGERIDWQDMAVVARSRQTLEYLERALASEGVPVRIRGAQAALRDEFSAYQLLRVAQLVLQTSPIDKDQAVELLTSAYCGLDNLGLRRLRRILRQQELDGGGERNSDQLLTELFSGVKALAGLSSPEDRGELRTARRFIDNFFRVRELMTDPTKTIEDLLWNIWKPSGLEERWAELSRGTGEVGVQAHRDLDAVVALFGAANRYIERKPAASASQFIEQQLEQSLPQDNITVQNRGRVTVDLVTPSGLVGNRYRVVAIPSLIEGVWPNLKPRSSLLGATELAARMTANIDSDGKAVTNELADERRMFYKAVGAASEQLLISAYEGDDTQCSQFIALAAGYIPEVEEFTKGALTLRGLVGDLRRQLSMATDPNVQVGLAIALARLVHEGVPGAHPEQWYGLAELSSDEPLFIAGESLVDEDGNPISTERIVINPSQLDDFIKCPLHWFLNYHGAAAKPFAANLGTLIHEVIEEVTATDEKLLLQRLETKWHTLRFESEWEDRMLRRKATKMLTNLATYMKQAEEDGTEVLAREAGFGFDLHGISIKGRIDRIEQRADGSIVIVDVKTGTIKATPPKDMHKNPQLGLYQLAYLNGALKASVPDSETLNLDSAKLLFVSGDKPEFRNQDSFSDSQELRAAIEEIVGEAAAGMAMPDRIFVARVNSHCTDDYGYGTCELHLTRAVSFYEQ